MVSETEHRDALYRAASDAFRNGRHEEAFERYLTLAEQGATACQTFVGWMYMTGTGVAEDLEKAEHWLKSAIQGGDYVAAFDLGVLYSKKSEYETAFQWFEQAADSGYLPAIYRLAVRLEDGKGVPRDKSAAYALFKQAASQGHLRSQRTYARRLIFGSEGVLGVFRGTILLGRFAVGAVQIGMQNVADERFRF